MIRHSFTEGWLLLRQRVLISLTLIVALAIPICLAGLTINVNRWLKPLIDSAVGPPVIAVLLHPQMGTEQHQKWLSDQATKHPDWTLNLVPPDQLALRLTHWFPYLGDILGDDDGQGLLPPLVEITTEDSDGVSSLISSPTVIAIGPRSTLQHMVRAAARRFGWALAFLTAALLGSAGLLAAVWVHLELYRHADEITIMRLVGATESSIRGPFLVAVMIPGALAGILAGIGTVALTGFLSRLATTLGLPEVTVSPKLLLFQCLLACLLPLAAGSLTLTRHAMADLEE